MSEIERGELFNCLMPFALYFEQKIKPTMTETTPGNTPLFDGAFTISDFYGPWLIMQHDDQAKEVFARIVSNSP